MNDLFLINALSGRARRKNTKDSRAFNMLLKHEEILQQSRSETQEHIQISHQSDVRRQRARSQSVPKSISTLEEHKALEGIRLVLNGTSSRVKNNSEQKTSFGNECPKIMNKKKNDLAIHL